MLEAQIKASETAVEWLIGEHKALVEARRTQDKDLKDLVQRVEKETLKMRKLEMEEKKAFQAVREEEYMLGKLKADLADEIREKAIQELIKEQPTYEEELERVISNYIRVKDTGLSFEAKKEPKEIIAAIKRDEEHGGLSDGAVAAMQARRSYNKAMRELCENHHDKQPLNKTARIEILKRFVRSDSVMRLLA